MGAFERIRDEWVPLWLKEFERKARDYNNAKDGWENHEVLGVKGQFADLWRKVGKLKKALWDGQPLEGEQPLEIIDDLISHLFLTRDLIIQEEASGRNGHMNLPSKVHPFAMQAGLRNACGPECSPRSHTFVSDCRYRMAP